MSQSNTPDDIDAEPLFAVLFRHGLAPSYGEARRLIRRGRVMTGSSTVTDPSAPILQGMLVIVTRDDGSVVDATVDGEQLLAEAKAKAVAPDMAPAGDPSPTPATVSPYADLVIPGLIPVELTESEVWELMGRWNTWAAEFARSPGDELNAVTYRARARELWALLSARGQKQRQEYLLREEARAQRSNVDGSDLEVPF